MLTVFSVLSSYKVVLSYCQWFSVVLTMSYFFSLVLTGSLFLVCIFGGIFYCYGSGSPVHFLGGNFLFNFKMFSRERCEAWKQRHLAGHVLCPRRVNVPYVSPAPSPP